MAGEMQQHWDYNPETGQYDFPSAEDASVTYCVRCGAELLEVGAVGLDDAPLCYCCHARSTARRATDVR